MSVDNRRGSVLPEASVNNTKPTKPTKPTKAQLEAMTKVEYDRYIMDLMGYQPASDDR